MTHDTGALPCCNFAGRTPLVSAGASGIGRGIIVWRLAIAGANVIFGGIDAAAGKELDAMLSVGCDLSKPILAPLKHGIAY